MSSSVTLHASVPSFRTPPYTTLNCPSPAELLVSALGDSRTNRDDAISAHVAGCSNCRTQITEIRETAAALISAQSEAASECLSDDSIAAMVDARGSALRKESVAHLSECADCRRRFASTVRMMDDDAIASEMRRLNVAQSSRPISLLQWSRRKTMVISGGLVVAAAAAIVLVGPIANREADNGLSDIHRESSITTTVAPRILSPANAAQSADSLRWTSVPTADLYRVRVWDTEGTVVFSGESERTSLGVPNGLRPGTSYLWEVAARTGWDRWVSSDFVEFRTPAARPR